MKQMPSKRKPVKRNWGDEILKTLGVIGKVLFRVFTVLLNIVLTVLLICIITAIIAGTAFAVYIKNYIDPSIDENLFTNGDTSQTTKIYYYDYTDRANRIGTAIELEDQRLYGTENSLWAPLSKIPKDMRDAFISIEDKRFNDHKGVDWIRSTKAILNFFLGFDSSAGGGSTITQQLVKNKTHYDDVTIQRKVQEMLMALNLEKIKTKDEILEMYLNIVPLSQRCIGVQAAANTYFSKDVSELNLIECCAIAAITNAPTRYDPIQNPENNAYRRNLILDFMLEFGCITVEEYEDAYTDITVIYDEETEKIKDIIINEEKLVLNYNAASSDAISTNSWYTDTVISDVINDLVEKKGYSRQDASNLIYYGGLQIFTTMDYDVQEAMESIFEDQSNFPELTSGVPAECAMCVLDPLTGDLLGVIGGRGEKTQNRILNHATQTTRPPGSSIKPLAVYGPSLEEKIINWATVFDDVPLNFGVNNNDPWPDNLPYVYEGLVNVKYGLATSKNTVSLKVLTKLGLDRSFSYMNDRFRLPTLVDKEYYSDGTPYTDRGLAALGLGQLNHGATVRDMVACYTALANEGVVSKCRSYLQVTDAAGNVILDNDYESRVVFSRETTYILTKILENVVDWGTSTKLTLDEKINCYGKTGTSNKDQDRWFMGYTPYYVGGVWYGYDTPKTMTNELWYSPANRIWDKVMCLIHADIIEAIESGEAEEKTFNQPTNVVKAVYCKYSGKLMTDACRHDPRYNASLAYGGIGEEGYFLAGTEPTEECDTHVLVSYDSVTGGIAHSSCPKENMVQVALLKLKEDRIFPMQIAVTDAQYIYRPLPANVRPSSYSFNPYFIALLPEKAFCGVTNYWGAVQYNTFCSAHFDYAAYDAGNLKDYHGIYAEGEQLHAAAQLALLPPTPEEDRRRRENELL